MEKQIKRLAFVWDFTVNPLQLYGWGENYSAEKYADKIYNGLIK